MSEQPIILSELERTKQKALSLLAEIQDEEPLQTWRREYLGKTSTVMSAFSSIGQQPKEFRPLVGQIANQVKQALEAALEERGRIVSEAALTRKIANERVDVTLPGRQPISGGLHPQTLVLRRIFAIFAEMGFQVYRSRDVESDEYNFELLNIPAHHPCPRYVGYISHRPTGGSITYPHVSGANSGHARASA